MKEFKDELHINSKIHPSFRLRMSVLFCTNIEHRISIKTKELMPEHRFEVSELTVYNLWDWLKSKFRKEKGMEEIEMKDDLTERPSYCPECNQVTFQTITKLNPDSDDPHDQEGYSAWVCTVCHEVIEIAV